MGRMKDLLITIYGGGDEAVEAAKQIAGLSEIVPHDDEPGWIPVEERLPEGADGEYVLVTDGNVVGMATHRNGWSHAIGRDGWTPTHWMPLPEPPEVK